MPGRSYQVDDDAMAKPPPKPATTFLKAYNHFSSPPPEDVAGVSAKIAANSPSQYKQQHYRLVKLGQFLLDPESSNHEDRTATTTDSSPVSMTESESSKLHGDLQEANTMIQTLQEEIEALKEQVSQLSLKNEHKQHGNDNENVNERKQQDETQQHQEHLVEKSQEAWQEEMEGLKKQHQVAANAAAAKIHLLKKSLKLALEQNLILDESKGRETRKIQEEMEGLRHEHRVESERSARRIDLLKTALKFALEQNQNAEHRNDDNEAHRGYDSDIDGTSCSSGMEMLAAIMEEPVHRWSTDTMELCLSEEPKPRGQRFEEQILEWKQGAETLENLVCSLQEDKAPLRAENETGRRELNQDDEGRTRTVPSSRAPEEDKACLD